MKRVTLQGIASEIIGAILLIFVFGCQSGNDLLTQNSRLLANYNVLLESPTIEGRVKNTKVETLEITPSSRREDVIITE